MPGLTAALASLQDVLEVKGCAISEPELWSVLCLCAEALQDLLFKGNVLEMDIPRVVVTPDTVYMRPDGKITLDNLSLETFMASDFCAPEWRVAGGNPQTESSLEKMWIFSLGMTLYQAADYNRDQHEELEIGAELHAVLADMCEEHAELRLTLTQIMQLSSSHAAGHMVESFSIHIMRMYELVFGSGDNISSVGQISNPSSITSSPQATHGSMQYDIRPAPVGKSATIDDAFSRASSIKPTSPHIQRVAHSPSRTNSHIHPNFVFAQSIEDSLKLSKLRGFNKSANIPQASHRHPFAAGSRLLQTTQRSMPALHINYNMPTAAHVAPISSDSYLQHAYERILQRRSLLSAIRHSLSNEELVDPLLYMNGQQLNRISDMQASANSLNYGVFHPNQFNQENCVPYNGNPLEPDRHRSAHPGDRPHSALPADRPHRAHLGDVPDSAQLLDRPKSAHPILISRDEAVDPVFGDPVIREAMVSSAEDNKWPSGKVTNGNTREVSNRGRAAQPERKRLPLTSVATRTPSNNKAVKGGPEFVRMAARPVRKLKDFWPHKSNSKAASVSVVIELLNGERLQLYCPSSATGQQLFDVMLREIQLPEYYYFGLTHYMGEEHIFIDPLKKVEKYIPSLKRRSVVSKSASNVSFTVHQRVKFYARSLAMIKHTNTQHLLYLQLRRDVVEDRLRTEDKELINLTGVALQVEYGNYDISQHHLNYFTVSYYFPQRLLKKMSKNRQLIVNKHAANSGQSALEAEAKFIEMAMELHEYGIHFYSAYRARNDPLSHSWIGVASRGLALAEKRGQQRSKYLIWLSEEQHAYLVQSMTRGDYHQAAIAAGALPQDVDYDADDFEVEEEYSREVFDGEEFDEASSYQFHRAEDEPLHQYTDTTDEPVARAPAVRRPSSRRREVEEEPVIEGVKDHGLSPPDIEETLSESLHDRFDAIPSDSPEKHFTAVKLTRDPVSGIGIRLAGGGSAGIFIASLLRGGAADRSGSLQSGDRIVAINGKSTEVLSQSHAMELIKKSNSVVELIVSQPVSGRGSDHPPSSEQESVSDYESTDAGDTVQGSEAIDPMENEEMRAALKAELEAEVAAIKAADPQDTSDVMSLQYQQHLAKYQPKHRVQVQPPIQLPAAPQPAATSPLSTAQPLPSTLKQELDDISSEERATPTFGALQSPTITNIDDISTDLSDEEASAFPSSIQQFAGVRHRPPIASISSTDAEGSEKGSKRLSAFASVSSPARKSQTAGAKASTVSSSAAAVLSRTVSPGAKAQGSKTLAVVSSPSISSTLSEHESDMYNSFNVSHLAAGNGQWSDGPYHRDFESDSTLRSESASHKAGSGIPTPMAVQTSQNAPVSGSAAAKRDYDSDGTSEEISDALTGPISDGRLQHTPTSTAGESVISSQAEASAAQVKLKTPINDRLEVGDNYELTLHKINQSLGLNVTGGVNTSVKHGGIYVKSLVPRGAADMSARIRIGDRVISVNTIHLTSVTHKQAVETLRNASNPVTLLMERGQPPASQVNSQTVSQRAMSSTELTSPGSEERDTPVSPRKAVDSITPEIEKLPIIAGGECSEIQLTKGTTGLGFSIGGGTNTTSSDPRLSLLKVKKIFPRGAAAQSGLLFVGDIILAVNGVSVQGLTHNETVQMLRTAPAVVKLYICRPDARLVTPPPDSNAASTDQPTVRVTSASQSRESTLTKSQSRESTLTKTSVIKQKSQSPSGTSPSSQSPSPMFASNQSRESTLSNSSKKSSTHSGQFQYSMPPTSQSQYSMPPTSQSGAPSNSIIRPQQSREPQLSSTARNETSDTRSSVSAASSTTYGTQDSSTSYDTVQTALKSPPVQEFEASLKRRRGIDYSLPTPIRELDDMLQENTSTHTSRTQSPQSLSRGSSINRSGRRLANEEDIAVVNDRLADVALSQDLGSDEESSTERSTDSSSDESTTDVASEHSSEVGGILSTPRTTQGVGRRDSEAKSVSDEFHKAVFSISSLSHSSSSASHSSLPDKIIAVTLEKDSYGSLGFSVAGAASLGGCYIKKVIKDPALADGTLQAGDKLLEVNGHDITQLSNPAAVALIKNQPATVTITILRPPSSSGAPTKPPRTDNVLRHITAAAETRSNSPGVQPEAKELITCYERAINQEVYHVSDTADATKDPEYINVTPSNVAGAHAASVSDNTQVTGIAGVPDTAQVTGVAGVPDTAHVTGVAGVPDTAQMTGVAGVPDTAHVTGVAGVPDTVQVTGVAGVRDTAHVTGVAGVRDTAQVTGVAGVRDNTQVTGVTGPHVVVALAGTTISAAELSEDDEFSSVEGEVPDDIEDSWSSDVYSDGHEMAQGVIPDSHIGTPSDLNSTIERTLDADRLPESRINTLSEQSCEDEKQEVEGDDPPQVQSPDARPQSITSQEESVSSWADSVALSDEGGFGRRFTPIDLTRGDSQRTATDGASSSPVGGLSRNASTHLSRHDSTHSNQSFLSTPLLSRNTSLKLPPTDEVYKVTLTKLSECASLGFSVLGMQVGGNLYACVKGLSKGGIAHTEGSISAGDKILQINGEDVKGCTEADIQSKCASILRLCEGQVVLIMSTDRADSYSDDLALIHSENEHSDNQLGALSDGPYQRRLMSRTPRRIFGPSVTTTDEDSDYDAADDLSAAIQHLSNNIERPRTAESEVSTVDSATDESSFDFELPDESQFLETSIRLTRHDMKTPLSDDTKRGSESDTDHVMSDDDTQANCARLTTDTHTDETDTEGSMKGFLDACNKHSRRATTGGYDNSNLPGATAEPTTAVQIRNKDQCLALATDSSGVRRGGALSAQALYNNTLIINRSQSHPVRPGDKCDTHAAESRPPLLTVECEVQTHLTASSSSSKSLVGSSRKLDADLELHRPFAINVTMAWVNSLVPVSTPPRGLYTDNAIEGVITDLLTRIANDDTVEEFKQLKSVKPVDQCTQGKLKENKNKNRFRNVLPYDQTRVVLCNEEDYINASHIQRSMGKECYNYIASQGPMLQTADDFWEMVLEQKVTIIAMVTQDVEKGKVKCHRYWPDSLYMPMVINDVYEVTLTKSFALKDFDVRHLQVTDLETNESRKLIHMNYTKWPDHGMPESAVPLLQFMRLMHELSSGGPTLVHCSAGIGRTGTLITLDIILGCIENNLKFDIHEIVTDLRKQRPGMIQTKDQYLFCYTATLEALESLRQTQPCVTTFTPRGSFTKTEQAASRSGPPQAEIEKTSDSTNTVGEPTADREEMPRLPAEQVVPPTGEESATLDISPVPSPKLSAHSIASAAQLLQSSGKSVEVNSSFSAADTLLSDSKEIARKRETDAVFAPQAQSSTRSPDHSSPDRSSPDHPSQASVINESLSAFESAH